LPIEPSDDQDVHGEPRLPVVVALAVAVVLPFLMPDQLTPGPRWLIPAILLSFAVPALVLDPGRIDQEGRLLHRIRLAFVVLFAATVTWATIVLAHILVVGAAGITNSPSGLLRAGGLVWLGLMIAFAFVYWELDLGGPGERAHSNRTHPDLAFPQDLNPRIAPAQWRPTFVDYLYLGLTNNLAFSPTDVMPLSQWAKLAMGLQSIGSVVLLTLVVARAVNILR
jgi:hypothetical protein